MMITINKNMTLLLASWILLPVLAWSQCTTFEKSPRGDEAIEAHVVYRDFIKNKNYEGALEYWMTAYELAPAADGKRSVQYTDGVTLYLDKFSKATSEEDKKAYTDKVIELYDQMAICYPKEKAFALGRKVYNMYYGINMDRASIYQMGKAALEAGGNNTEYIALIPTADGLVSEYKAGNVSVEEAREVFNKLHEIADYNIANNATFKDYYSQSKEGMNGFLAAIEPEIFDCQYFKDKYEAQYRADSENRELYREIYKALVRGGCDKEDPLLKEISKKDETFLAAEKAAKIAELQKDNPAWHANNLYKEGRFAEAVQKYEEAISKESDPEKLSSYYFSMASIQFRKLDQYSKARASARKAAELRSGWGRPYMLIGDMYGSSARSCGDAWNQRLAILAAVEKYSYAKSIDPEVASDASQRISKYRASYPDQNEGFMRGVQAGQKAKVGCWIGETVTVRFK